MTKLNYKNTVRACYFGYIVQAVVNNFLPLLFAFFNKQFNISLTLISVLITYNFSLQILFDAFSSKIILKIGYRKTAILADVSCAIGLVIASLSTLIFTSGNIIFGMLMVSITFMAIGGGIMEVIISPLVDALPLENKSSNMSFLHSGYCLGHFFIVLFATIYFYIFGVSNWNYFAMLLCIIPFTNIILFISCPIVAPMGDDKPVKISGLFKNKLFILLFVMMLGSGATELAVAQWISYYAESGLNVNKTIGDLIGVCSFALFMFIGRIISSKLEKKIKLTNVIKYCSIILILIYVFAIFSPNPLLSILAFAICGAFVSVMWPGTYSLGSEVFIYGGTTMFSLLALSGDIGCTVGPSLVGYISNFAPIKYGMLSTIVFPTLILVCVLLIEKSLKKDNLPPT